MNKEHIGQLLVTEEDLKAIANHRAYKDTVKHMYIFLGVFTLVYLPSLFLIVSFIESSYISMPIFASLTIPLFYYMIKYINLAPRKLTKTYANKLMTEIKISKINDIVSNRHND